MKIVSVLNRKCEGESCIMLRIGGMQDFT